MKVVIECTDSLQYLLTEGISALLEFKQVEVIDDTKAYIIKRGKYSSSMDGKFKQIAVYEMSYFPYDDVGEYDPIFRLDIF
jgi:hypothetical protein